MAGDEKVGRWSGFGKISLWVTTRTFGWSVLSQTGTYKCFQGDLCCHKIQRGVFDRLTVWFRNHAGLFNCSAFKFKDTIVILILTKIFDWLWFLKWKKWNSDKYSYWPWYF